MYDSIEQWLYLLVFLLLPAAGLIRLILNKIMINTLIDKIKQVLWSKKVMSLLRNLEIKKFSTDEIKQLSDDRCVHEVDIDTAARELKQWYNERNRITINRDSIHYWYKYYGDDDSYDVQRLYFRISENKYMVRK